MPHFVVIVLSLLLSASFAEAKPAVVAPPRQSNALERLARQFEPDLVGQRERLPQYVEFFRSKLANDTRLFAFDVRASVTASGRVRLQGYVESSQTRSGLVQFLTALGFDVADDELETLPSESLGKMPSEW